MFTLFRIIVGSTISVIISFVWKLKYAPEIPKFERSCYNLQVAVCGLCSVGLAPMRVAVRAAVVALLSPTPASLIAVRYLRLILFVG